MDLERHHAVHVSDECVGHVGVTLPFLRPNAYCSCRFWLRMSRNLWRAQLLAKSRVLKPQDQENPVSSAVFQSSSTSTPPTRLPRLSLVLRVGSPCVVSSVRSTLCRSSTVEVTCDSNHRRRIAAACGCIWSWVSHSARHPAPASGLAGVFPEASSHGCCRR